MLKKPLFLETFLLLAIVGVLNYVATTYDLYWSVTEFDSLMHFLGGATVAIFFLWSYFYSGAFNSTNTSLTRFLSVSLLGLLLVAVLWEIYELVLGEAKFAKSTYLSDTTLDFIMDFLGGIVACMYAYLRKIKSTFSVL